MFELDTLDNSCTMKAFPSSGFGSTVYDQVSIDILIEQVAGRIDTSFYNSFKKIFVFLIHLYLVDSERAPYICIYTSYDRISYIR